MRFFSWVKNEQSGLDELRIDGPIAEEDWWGDEQTPKRFRQELERRRDAKELVVWINSPGGEVVAGSEIYTMLKEHPAQIIVKIDGWAASAASVIAMAGDKVLMAPTALMMIHNPWGMAIGDADDLRRYSEALDAVKESIMNAYELKTKLDRATLAELMDAETYMDAKSAISKGFADEMLFQEEASTVTARALSRAAIYNCCTVHRTLITSEPQNTVNQEAEKMKLHLQLLSLQ